MPSKYGNIKTFVDGIKFDSKKEAARYEHLKLLVGAKGGIRDLELQPRFTIRINDKHICHYYADFRYVDSVTGKTIVEDVKSPATAKKDIYRLKKKLVEAVYGITIIEVIETNDRLQPANPRRSRAQSGAFTKKPIAV